MPPFLSHVLLMSVSLWGSHAVSRRIFIGLLLERKDCYVIEIFMQVRFHFSNNADTKPSQRAVIPFHPKPNFSAKEKEKKLLHNPEKI